MAVWIELYIYLCILKHIQQSCEPSCHKSWQLLKNIFKVLNNTVRIENWAGNSVFTTFEMFFNIIFICLIIKFQFFNMIFNTPQITGKLNPAWDVLKIMWKNWTMFVMQIQHLTAVEKHLASNEKCCTHWKLTRKPLYNDQQNKLHQNIRN